MPHIERKKSKCDYELSEAPTAEMMAEVERRINEVIEQHLPVTIEFIPKAEAGAIVDLSKLPEDASETLRIVRVGDYDACACIGAHVSNTSEIGRFKLLITIILTDGYACGSNWKLLNKDITIKERLLSPTQVRAFSDINRI